METNIDDTTGEGLGFIMEELLDKGANDVYYTPIFMKKNRPAYKLNLLCREQLIPTMEAAIFKNTTSIGVRKYKVDREILPREIVHFNTNHGTVRFKVCRYGDETYYYPEYEDIKEICKRTGLGFKRVLDELKRSRDIKD